MKNGLHVITAQGCPHCDTFKEKNKDKIGSEIQEIIVNDIDDQHEVWDVIEGLEIIGTPTVVKKDGDKICEVNTDDLETELKCIDLGKPKAKSKGKKSKSASPTVDFILKNVGGTLY